MPDPGFVPVFGEPSWPLVVAHRGASLERPENTLPAFEAAVRAGADAVELDVRLTADGIPVICHDADVSRVTDGAGLVHELTLAELKLLDASGGPPSSRDVSAPDGSGRVEIATLFEALDLLGGRAGIDIEIKNNLGDPAFDSPREAVAEQVVKMVDEMGLTESVLVSSFNWLSIERVRDLDASIPTGFLTTTAFDPRAALVYARQKGHAFVLPEAHALVQAGESFVAEAHAAGVRVGTWTVDDPERLRMFFAWGVDAVISNDPVTGLAVRDASRPGNPSG